MTAFGEAHAGNAGAATPAPVIVERTPFWQSRAAHRYGFVALLLIAWELIGPTINPIFFTYPSQIAKAFYELTVSGELLYFTVQSLEVLVYGLSIAIAIGIPLGVAM